MVLPALQRLRIARIFSALVAFLCLALGIGVFASIDYIVPAASEHDILSHRKHVEQFRAQNGSPAESRSIILIEDAIRVIETAEALNDSIRRMLIAQANMFLTLAALSGISWWFLRPRTAT